MARIAEKLQARLLDGTLYEFTTGNYYSLRIQTENGELKDKDYYTELVLLTQIFITAWKDSNR